MGKTKRNRQRRKNEPTGLESVRDAEADMERAMEQELLDEGLQARGVVANVIERLQSVNADERECGCAVLGSILSHQASIEQLLSAKVVKIVGPLMMDPSLAVRKNALGALRNISVDGGREACEEMVSQDIMTPVIALLQQYGPNWAPEVQKKKEDIKQEIFLQATHLLWNLCESSDIAVGIMTKHNVLPVLLPCLQPDVYGYTLAVTVAQCLYTATDNNPVLVSELGQPDVMTHLQKVITTTHDTTEQLLLRTLATGIMYNITVGKLGSASGEIMTSVVQVLAEVLDQDTNTQLQRTAELIAQITAMNKQPEETADEVLDPHTPDVMHKDLDDRLGETLHLLSAQTLAVEMAANLCCTDDEDEDWEDLDSSDNGSDDLSVPEMAMDEAAAAGALPPLCVPSEVHGAFVSNNIIAKVLSKTGLPEATLGQALNSHVKGKRLLKSLRNLQSRSLFCVGNIVGAMETSSVGGTDNMHSIWTSLSQLATLQPVLQDMELLEAVTSAMRAVAQKLTESGSSKFSEVTSRDLQFLFEMGQQCDLDTVRANTVRIISTVGCSLATNPQPHTLLKNMGLFLLETASKDKKLWVVAEALDALFDVFAEDHLNPIVQEINLIDKLKALTPGLKTKIQQQKRTLGEHLPIISTTRTNLVRFIKYKQGH